MHGATIKIMVVECLSNNLLEMYRDINFIWSEVSFVECYIWKE